MNWIKYLEPLGVDLFCLRKKFLVFHLVERDIKVRYRRSVLGIFWTLLVPMASAALYYFVFRFVVKIQIPNYLIMILSGILPWTFFSQTLAAGTESLVGNHGLLTKVPIPIQIFPYTIALSNFVTLLLSLPVIAGACLISGVGIGVSFLMFFYYAALLFLMAYALAAMLSIFYVYFRDLRHMVGIGIQFLFYLSPVLYRGDMMPEQFRWILYVNPLAMIFSGLHSSLAEGVVPQGEEIWVPAAWTFTVLFTSLLVQRLYARKVAEFL